MFRFACLVCAECSRVRIDLALLAQSDDLAATTQEHGVSMDQVLLEACTSCHVPLLRRTLECGANANAQGPRGQLAIEIAISAQADSLQCVEILLPHSISLVYASC